MALLLFTRYGLSRDGSAPPPTADYSDDFEGHAVATGIPTGWSDGGGSASPTWSITNTSPLAGAKSLHAASVTGVRNLLITGSSLEDGIVTAHVQPTSTTAPDNNMQPGIIARYADAANLVRVRASRLDSRRGLILSQRVANTETELGFAAYSLATGTTYIVELELTGTSATARLKSAGGSLLVSTAGTVSLTAAGPVGITAVGGTAVMMFDGFEANLA